MEVFAEHVGISLGESLLLGLALWSWAAFCASAIANVMSKTDFITASPRTVRLSGVSCIVLITAESTCLYFDPRAALLGIHGLAVSPPLTWWLWGGVLVCEPLVSAAKIFAYRSLLQEEATRKGKPVQVKPQWETLLDAIGDILSDGTNYVWRFRS